VAQQPTDLPPELIAANAFLDRNKGTLPEEITAADLQTLNAGLGFFFSKLRLAAGLFHQSADDGRHAAIVAADAAWRLIALFRPENLSLPLLHLRDALRLLDEGTAVPMLMPVSRPGGRRSTDAYDALRGQAAGTVARLVETGLLRPDAYGLVAEALVKLGVPPERGKAITARTVRLWCAKNTANANRSGAAAIVYDGMFTDEERQRFAGLPSDEARQALALNSLAAFVRTHFPRP
jgi:hypothetical protein